MTIYSVTKVSLCVDVWLRVCGLGTLLVPPCEIRASVEWFLGDDGMEGTGLAAFWNLEPTIQPLVTVIGHTGPQNDTDYGGKPRPPETPSPGSSYRWEIIVIQLLGNCVPPHDKDCYYGKGTIYGLRSHTHTHTHAEREVRMVGHAPDSTNLYSSSLEGGTLAVPIIHAAFGAGGR